MLKLATEEEERFGGVLMEWWKGDGAARVGNCLKAFTVETVDYTISPHFEVANCIARRR
jgi:streptomycin 6-kinase